MLQAAAAGHRIVMHVHDEIVIYYSQNSGFTVKGACRFMSTTPDWATGLSLEADCYECAHYPKISV